MATGNVEVKLKSIKLFDPNEDYEEPAESIKVKSTDDKKYPGKCVI